MSWDFRVKSERNPVDITHRLHFISGQLSCFTLAATTTKKKEQNEDLVIKPLAKRHFMLELGSRLMDNPETSYLRP